MNKASQGKCKMATLGNQIVGNSYRMEGLLPAMDWLQKEDGRVVDAHPHISSVAGRVTSVLRICKQGDIA